MISVHVIRDPITKLSIFYLLTFRRSDDDPSSPLEDDGKGEMEKTDASAETAETAASAEDTATEEENDVPIEEAQR